MKWIVKLLFAAAALWSGYWFIGAQAQEKIYAGLLESSRQQGWTAESQNLGVVGFPNRFDTTLTGLNFADPSGRWRWRGEEFQIKALSYQPNHVIMAWPGTQEIGTPAGSATVNAGLLRASVVVSPESNLPLSRVQIEGTGIDIKSNRGWAAAISSLNSALFQDDTVPTRYRLGVDAADIAPPDLLTSVIGGGASMPALIEKVYLSAELDFDREIDRLAFASGAPPKPTTAVIEQAEIIWGSSTLGLNGELRAGSNGYVEGYLEFDVEGWQPLFDIYNSAARMSATEKLTLKRALDAASGGGNLAFTLRFSGGEASIGPFTIGPAPVYPF